ncbi:MAG: hypothetical protein V3V00_15925 [Saprospiraceae bacterium]
MSAIRPADFFRWATNIVNDPTTLQDNRTAITVALKDNGWVPFGIKPARQKMNESLYQLGLWSEWNLHASKQYKNSRSVFIGDYNFRSNTASASEILIGDGTKVSAICEKFNDPDIHCAVEEISAISSKDQALTWAEGDGNGLNASGASPTNQFIYLFMISKDDGTGDLATDIVLSGANVKANGAVIAAGYTHIRHICTLSYLAAGWRRFVYQSDNRILYLDDTNTQIAFNVSSATYANQTISDAGGNLFPTEYCIAKVIVESNAPNGVDNPIFRSHIGSAAATDDPNEFELTQQSMTFAFDLDETESKFRLKGVNANATGMSIYAIGYKNPAILD